MATLYDLAMQYLNQSLPKTFKYDRTNQPGTLPPVTLPPQDPNAPTARILPVQGGNEEGFSVYNPDPNRTRTGDNYSPYNYRQAAERNLIGSGDSQFDINKYGTGFRSETETQKFMDMYPDYYRGNKQLEGIPGMVQGYMKNSLAGRLIGNAVSGLESLLPVNQRAILENELLGQGFQLNDIGQFVSDGGDAYKEDGSNIMAGYNAAKVTRQTFDKRRAKAKENMTPEGFEKFNTALTAAEDKFFGGSGKATTVFNDQLKQKDIDDGFINDQIPTYDEEIKTSTYSEDEEDNILDDILDYTNKNIYNTKNIYTSVPESTYDEEIFDPGDGTGTTGSVDPAGINTIDSTVYANEDNPNSVSTSGLTYTQGGGQDGSYDFVEQNFEPPAVTEAQAYGSCFIAGTKISMADGTLKNIEDIIVGDKVKGHKEENIVIKLDPTLLANRKLYSFNDNEHYFFTSEHPFMTEEGWKSIKPEKTKERDGVELYNQLKGELKIGDKLVTENGLIEIKNIKSKEMNNLEMPLYNFNVSNDNSYIADKYIVHNKGNQGSADPKIVCTMMNQSYGFGSFRNKIWKKFHKDLSPEYQKGYHKLFLPLVRIAKTNKVVKKILEHIAVHSTIDMRQATRGKMHLLGRIYRKILLPLCYFVGKHG